MVRVPRRPRRQALRLVVVGERGERVPSRVARVVVDELHHARREHQAEEQPADEPHPEPRGLRRRREARPERPRRHEHREQARFEQQRVPLEAQEHAACAHERQIESPEREQAGAGCHARHHGEPEHGPGIAETQQGRVARVEPRERRQEPEALGTEALRYASEKLADRQDTMTAEETEQLHA